MLVVDGVRGAEIVANCGDLEKSESQSKFPKFLGITQFIRLSWGVVVVLTIVGALDEKSKDRSFIGTSKKNHRGIFF